MRPLAIVGEEAVAPDALPAALLVVAAADWAGSLGGEPLLRTDPGRATHAMRSGHRWRILSLHPPRHRGVQIWPGCRGSATLIALIRGSARTFRDVGVSWPPHQATLLASLLESARLPQAAGRDKTSGSPCPLLRPPQAGRRKCRRPQFQGLAAHARLKGPRDVPPKTPQCRSCESGTPAPACRPVVDRPESSGELFAR